MRIHKMLRKFSGVSVIITITLACVKVPKEETFLPTKNAFTADAEHIDPATALLSDGFETCNELIFQYYNPKPARYSSGKNGLRKFIMSKYVNKNYPDSGYLNIRFVINCHGKPGRYVIHENDLDLSPTSFTKELTEQLVTLTTQLQEWEPNLFTTDSTSSYVDSYMYISYRIEHGNITEILP